MVKIHRILFPTDFSQNANAARDLACGIELILRGRGALVQHRRHPQPVGQRQPLRGRVLGQVDATPQFQAGDADNSGVLMGEVSGLIHDAPPAAQIVEDMVAQACQLLGSKSHHVVG